MMLVSDVKKKFLSHTGTLFTMQLWFLSAEVNVGFQQLHYVIEEDTNIAEACLQVFGSETLSQASLVRVQTVDGSAEGNRSTCTHM